MDERELLQRRYEREHAARKSAEALIEQKSLELYHANRELREFNATLEQRVLERTAELAAARDEALAASKAKSLFIANISHELRTPLHAIISYGEMIQEALADAGDAPSLRDLGHVLAAARQLRGLINGLLDFTKLEAGKLHLIVEDFALAPLLHEVAATVQPMADKNHNRFELDLAADLGWAHSDRLKLQQILSNLLSNACKFTEHGLVRLLARREDGPAGERLAFVVEDSGIGISAEQLGRLFQPFTQADASTSRKYGGTGLGLVLCRELAGQLGGTLTVASTPGQGTRFGVALPARLAGPAVPAMHHDREDDDE